MPPKKKQKTNAFMVFCLEWKSKYGRGITLLEATEKAGRVWTTMDASQRAPYNDKAKEERMLVSRSAAKKLTCTGMPVSQVEKERVDHANKERLIKRDIEMTVAKSVKSDQLENQSYYFIMTNYFSKTLKGGVYVPAEVAVCKFSLKDGVGRTYQTLINPGVNIYGHQYEAQHHSETTHNLPLPPNALGETNLGNIYNDILTFIRDDDTNNYPPVYTHGDCVHIVESSLEFLKADIGANNVDLKVYPIQYLFYIMKEATCEAGELEKPSSFHITDAYFERDFFEYQINIGCQFHEDLDKGKYCTQSYVTRWGYMFADYMCRDIAIPLVPGRHCPLDTNINAIITPAPSTNNDDKSFISVDTTATAGTKALTDSKLYYDDQKASISGASKAHMEPYYPSSAGRSGGGASRRKRDDTPSPQRQKLTHKLSSSSDSEVDDLNPWTSRSRNVPREPKISDFDIDYSSSRDLKLDVADYNSVANFGRGRALPLNSSRSPSASSSGRGRYFRS